MSRECGGMRPGESPVLGTGPPAYPSAAAACPSRPGQWQLLCELANCGACTVAAFQGHKDKVTCSYKTSILV